MKTLSRPSGLLAALILVPALLSSGCSSSRSGWGVSTQNAPRASLYFISAEEILNYPSATTVEDLLEQHFSGFRVRTPDERPGAVGEVYLVGAANPLFVIDGVPTPYRGALALNPQDVSSIELVKHGASALYGFRGSAGAILITTRKK